MTFVEEEEESECTWDTKPGVVLSDEMRTAIKNITDTYCSLLKKKGKSDVLMVTYGNRNATGQARLVFNNLENCFNQADYSFIIWQTCDNPNKYNPTYYDDISTIYLVGKLNDKKSEDIIKEMSIEIQNQMTKNNFYMSFHLIGLAIDVRPPSTKELCDDFQKAIVSNNYKWKWENDANGAHYHIWK